MTSSAFKIILKYNKLSILYKKIIQLKLLCLHSLVIGGSSNTPNRISEITEGGSSSTSLSAGVALVALGSGRSQLGHGSNNILGRASQLERGSVGLKDTIQ
jgi:hypothetical protein